MASNLTQEERRKIYEEEKQKNEQNGCECSSIIVFVAATLSVLAIMCGIIHLSRKKVKPKLEDLRRAYPGL